ncbi:Ser/Thr protein phosphatase protein [Trametes polyzona]|nr:Ser/Thr protein phosphatase protein [Trametes polyzona]
MVNDSVSMQVLSDLHLEFPPPMYSNIRGPYSLQITPRTDILALLGDIGCTRDDALFEWLRTQLRKLKLVFFLSGNHEPYGSSLDESNRRLADFSKSCLEKHEKATPEEPFGRFILLDRTRYDLSPTLTVLGCTLWSRLDPDNTDLIHIGLNDFHQIAGLTPPVYDALHERDLAWLERSIADIAAHEPHRKIVVMTHHAPTVQGTSNPLYDGSPIGSAFSTELVGGPCWKPQVKVWAFGHTHWACDFEREGIRVVSNPKGYKGGGTGFDPEKVVVI